MATQKVLELDLRTQLRTLIWAVSTQISATLIKPASTLKALELNPDNPDTLINLSSIYKDLGNLDQALASTLKA